MQHQAKQETTYCLYTASWVSNFESCSKYLKKLEKKDAKNYNCNTIHIGKKSPKEYS